MLHECYVAFILHKWDAKKNTLLQPQEPLRTAGGLSRQQPADAVGVHYQTIGYLERGEYSPSLTLALRLSEVLGRPLEELFSVRPF